MKKLSAADMDPPAIGLITGPPSAGKTSLVLAHFPDYRWLVTRPSQLKPAIKAGLKVPESVFFFDALAHDPFGEWFATLKALEGAPAEKLPKGLVVDELSSILNADDGAARLQVGWAKVEDLRVAALDLIRICRARGVGLVLISHWREAVYHDRDGKGQQGDLKHPGGPAVPIGSLIHDLVKELDYVWKIEIREDSSRVLRLQPTATEFLKPGVPDAPSEVPLTAEAVADLIAKAR